MTSSRPCLDSTLTHSCQSPPSLGGGGSLTQSGWHLEVVATFHSTTDPKGSVQILLNFGVVEGRWGYAAINQSYHLGDPQPFIITLGLYALCHRASWWMLIFMFSAGPISSQMAFPINLHLDFRIFRSGSSDVAYLKVNVFCPGGLIHCSCFFFPLAWPQPRANAILFTVPIDTHDGIHTYWFAVPVLLCGWFVAVSVGPVLPSPRTRSPSRASLPLSHWHWNYISHGDLNTGMFEGARDSFSPWQDIIASRSARNCHTKFASAAAYNKPHAEARPQNTEGNLVFAHAPTWNVCCIYWLPEKNILHRALRTSKSSQALASVSVLEIGLRVGGRVFFIRFFFVSGFYQVYCIIPSNRCALSDI